MTAGQNGMAMARFPGERPKQTECPNLLIDRPVMKKPAAKAPADVVDPGASGESAGGDDADSGDGAEKCAGHVAARKASKAPKRHADGGFKTTERHRLYSQVYRKVRTDLQGRGVDIEVAKERAQKAARLAVAKLEK